MLPFYIYYSMFGFQRVGDQIWAAADQCTRGFLIGATSGRTTLGGEGLQHQDGTSQLVAGTIPNCKAYDPAFAGELAVIIDQGMQEMMVEQKDVFYYITTMNENYPQPTVDPSLRAAILKGGYLFQQIPGVPAGGKSSKAKPVCLMGSGALLNEAIKAGQQLSEQGHDVSIFSVTSWSELSRDQSGYVSQLLNDHPGPIVAVSDYVRAVPEAIRQHIPEGRSFVTLGTDGFGRSDTRTALRAFFGVNAQHIIDAAQSRS
jgi:pyruvate dehydrogenase E1 component